MPWYALRQNYAAAVEAAGGLPVMLPHLAACAEAYLDRLDGLVITGGAFDIDPALWGADSRHATVSTKDARTAFELAALTSALRRNLPLLGICGGEQLLAVALGGTLIQHIPDEVANPLVHEQPQPRMEPQHTVMVTPGTVLHRVTGLDRLEVNSTHHQAVKTPGTVLQVNAVASDGVIEGVEDPSRRFCVGVQWHPEYHVGPGDRALFDALVAACQ